VQKSVKKEKKCTRPGAAELKAIRLAMRFDMRSMAAILEKMPYRTYQDYEYDKRKVPEEVLVMARAAAVRDRELVAQIARDVAAEIDRQFPLGIVSVKECCE
jgi:hypothetical protein